MGDNFRKSFKLDVIKNGARTCVSIFGSGGKTSLLFLLAEQAAANELSVLVSTTTKMWIPQPHQYTAIELSGTLPLSLHHPPKASIIVLGRELEGTEKMQGVEYEYLKELLPLFDITLLETDGAACKPLKGWRDDEPLVPPFTTHSIGVVDISQIGNVVTEKSVHRSEIFSRLTQTQPEQPLSIESFARIISSPNGLMRHAKGTQYVFFNKTETKADYENCRILSNILPKFQLYAGSILRREINKL